MEEENRQVVKSFKDLGLCDELLEAVKKMNWDSPTRVQAESLPHALEGKDLIVHAETGTGKTAAFGLPILQALLNSAAHPPFFACVLAPTRELAIQIAEQFEALGAGIHVKTTVLVGGIDMVHQQISLAKRPHIVVATPGRLEDHMTNTKGFSLSALKYLVLDEADRLLSDEFEKSMEGILKAIPRKRRTYLFSATMDFKVKEIQRAGLRNPVKISTVASKCSTVDTLKEQYLFIPAKYKDCYLVYLLMAIHGSAMVFIDRCQRAPLLASMLRNLGFRALPITGKMPEPQRLGALNKFKSGECNILVCTDVVGRGHDIPSVSTVISYCVPNPTDYVHHVGRTARAGRSGVAISLVDQYEVEAFVRIEKFLRKKLSKFPADDDEALLLLERVTEAKRISHKTIRSRESERGKKRKKGGMGDDEEEEEMEKNRKYLDKKKPNKFPKLSKRKINI